MSDTIQESDASKVAIANVRTGSSDVRGAVRVSPTVHIEFIELTVRGIDGIDGLRSRGAKVASTATGQAKNDDNGKIAAPVSGDQIDAVLALAIRRGTNVSEPSAELQKRIGFAAGYMLGMTVRTVDLYVEEIVSGSSES